MPAIDMMQGWSSPISLADRAMPDCPLIYVNPAFGALAGYSPAEIIGRNCRFLQGRDTDPVTVRRMRESLRDGRDFSGCLRNYRRDGTAFDNFLFMAHVEAIGECRPVIGFQYRVMAGLPLRALDLHRQLIAQLAGTLGRVVGAFAAMSADRTLFEVTSAARMVDRYFQGTRGPM